MWLAIFHFNIADSEILASERGYVDRGSSSLYLLVEKDFLAVLLVIEREKLGLQGQNRCYCLRSLARRCRSKSARRRLGVNTGKHKQKVMWQVVAYYLVIKMELKVFNPTTVIVCD